jgi:secreted PhoX family phosphatase
VTCAEVVNRGTSDKKHGYVFEIDPRADAAVPAVPVPQAGRFEHEGGRLRGGIVYLTEDRRIEPDPVLVRIGAAFYRFVPDRRIGAWGTLAETPGVLQALKLRDEFRANMESGRPGYRSRSSGQGRRP